MQLRFDFLRLDILRWRGRLVGASLTSDALPPLSPVDQLVKSLISSRTRDEVSLPAYERLRTQYPDLAAICGADMQDIEAVICDVSFAADKAGNLRATLRLVARDYPGFDLLPLGNMPLDKALGWLESLPGVGRKVAAATLNASRLAMPVMVVDTHILRVLRRLGAIAPRASGLAASDAVTGSFADWNAADFRDLHARLKRLGQTVCHHGDPECGLCPLREDCRTARRNRAGAAPSEHRPDSGVQTPVSQGASTLLPSF